MRSIAPWRPQAILGPTRQLALVVTLVLIIEALHFGSPLPYVSAVHGALYQESSSDAIRIGLWTDWDASQHSGGKAYQSTAAGAEWRFEFIGSFIGLVYAKCSACGIASIYIDGVLVDSVDMYYAVNSYQQEREWTTTPDASHTLSVIVSGNKNASSSGIKVVVDAAFAEISVAAEIPISFPSAYPWTAGLDSNGAYGPAGINLGTGSQTLSFDDLVLPTKLGDFAFRRYYTSANTVGSYLGQFWSHSFDWYVRYGTYCQSWLVTYPGGNTYDFVATGQRDQYGWYTYTSPPGNFDTLTSQGTCSSEGLRLKRKDGSTVNFAGYTRWYRPTDISSPLSTITFAYDPNLTSGFRKIKLVRYDDTNGDTRKLYFYYAESSPNRLVWVSDSTGRTVRYDYSLPGGPKLITASIAMPDPTSQWATTPKWQYTWDGYWLSTVTDPSGRQILRNQLNATKAGIVRVYDALNDYSDIFYRRSLNSTRLTDPRGHATTFNFDTRKRVTSLVDPVGTISYTYDAADNRTSVTDRRGDRTDYTYDGRGNVTSVTGPSVGGTRRVTSYAYDLQNNTTQRTDPLGFTTTWTHDSYTQQVLTEQRQISGSTYATTQYAYAFQAPRVPGPTTITSPAGRVTTLAYDGDGNLTSVTDGDGAKTTFGYDSLGRRTTTVTPEGNVTGGYPALYTWTSTYDLQGRVSSSSNPLGQTRSQTYDAAGRVLTSTDARANVTTNGYDANGALASVQQKPDPVGQPSLTYTTTLTRDASGNVTRVESGNGNDTDYAYDDLDRLVGTTTYPSPTTPLTTSLQLDASGNVTARTTADGVAVSYAYDALNRLASVAGPSIAIGYGYDLAGHRTSITDATGTSTYAFDGLGRMTQAVQPNGALSYAYDLDSNRTSLTYPGSQTVSYAYTPGGRLSTVTDWANRVSQYTYGAGMLEQLDYPNGMSAVYTWDRAQRLTNIVNAVGGNVVSSHVYTLDAEGNHTALDEFVSGITTPGATDHFDYTYDGLNRLVSVGTTNPETFTLDGASNITARTGPSASWAIDGSDRPTTGMTWSDADRLVARGADSFTYDALDRLTSSTVGGTTRTYTYNGDGLLQSRNPGAANFLWDPASSPSRLLQVGTDKIVYGIGPLYVATASGVTNLARDGQKSIRAEVSGPSVAASFRYRAYGETAQAVGAAAPSYLAYSGQLLDLSGHYYMRARWYDASTGRFVTRDPLAGPSGVAFGSTYSYAAANPLTMSDPTGLAATRDETDAACPYDWCGEDYVPYNEVTEEAVLSASTNPIVLSSQTTMAVLSVAIGAIIDAKLRPAGVPLGEDGKITEAVRGKLGEQFAEFGCHDCGSRNAGTMSGRPIGDHMPPTKTMPAGTRQRAYAQCNACSNLQGAAVSWAKKQTMTFATEAEWRAFFQVWLKRFGRFAPRG